MSASDDQDRGRQRAAELIGILRNGDPDAKHSSRRTGGVWEGMPPADSGWVIEELAGIGAPAVDELILALDDRRRFASWAAAEALVRIGDPRSFRPLMAVISWWGSIAEREERRETHLKFGRLFPEAIAETGYSMPAEDGTWGELSLKLDFSAIPDKKKLPWRRRRRR